MSSNKPTYKHKYSISGREFSNTKTKKRQRSSEEIKERKKGKHQFEICDTDSDNSDTHTDFEDHNIESVTDLRQRFELSTDEMDEEKFLKFFASALRNDEINGLMATTFEKTVDRKLKPVIDSINSVKAENIERDEKVRKLEDTCSSLEAQIDEFEQQKCNRNIIISGLNEKDCDQEGALNFLKTVPGVNISIFDIDYVLKLRTQTNTNRMRVVLQTKEKKIEIMKAKKSLGQEIKTWINDDLTPFRARLGFQARQGVKAGKLQQTWIFDGKIFIKMNGETSGKLVKTMKDLPATEM